ncbi:MAG: hypothetical protein WD512_16270 [Candidatus Paceibacterota bacterium]
MRYSIPIIYRITHYGMGLIARFYYPIAPIFMGYQLLQYGLNRRFFIFSWEAKKNNSLLHTSIKVSEFIIGYVVIDQALNYLVW